MRFNTFPETFVRTALVARALLLPLLLLAAEALAQDCEFTLAKLKYEGGGDWYANPSSLPNLVQAVRQRTKVPICDTVATAALLDDELFRYPFIYMTGHGNVTFSHAERLRLRSYLIGGGFLWADDNYGLDKSFRREIASLFPENPLVQLPTTHPIYRTRYRLRGLPKIHEHDGEPAQGFGVFFDGRLVVFYTYSSDIGDGMEDLHVHNDGKELHELALQMGVNVVTWFFDPNSVTMGQP
jgi:hypothetical protein